MPLFFFSYSIFQLLIAQGFWMMLFLQQGKLQISTQVFHFLLLSWGDLINRIHATRVAERNFLTLVRALILCCFTLSSKRSAFKGCITIAIKRNAPFQYHGKKKAGFNCTGLRGVFSVQLTIIKALQKKLGIQKSRGMPTMHTKALSSYHFSSKFVQKLHWNLLDLMPSHADTDKYQAICNSL